VGAVFLGSDAVKRRQDIAATVAHCLIDQRLNPSHGRGREGCTAGTVVKDVVGIAVIADIAAFVGVGHAVDQGVTVYPVGRKQRDVRNGSIELIGGAI